MHIVCPHCRNPMEAADGSYQDVLCPSCGSSFRLERDTSTVLLPADGRQTLGRFVLCQSLGMGAFGVVYKARDPELDRVVAVKVPRGGNLGSGADQSDRFLREARSVAQLRHPGIVPVLEVGQHDSLPYLVTEFVPGLTLADWLSAHRPTARQAALLLARLAEALQYAHEHGVVHRDLKPSNVMLEEDGTAGGDDVPLPGRPRLMDFGLAKRDAGEITVTVEGQVLGTPAYMSPEQARGEAHTVDARGDVYSLGVILYEMLTGELPFRGNARMLLHQVLHDEPRPPRRLNDRIPRDLETICLKAMAKEAARRYPSAAALADDLHRFLKGEPIRARPVSVWERGAKWVRRHPAPAALLAVCALSVLTVLVVVLAYNVRLESALRQTTSARDEAERQRDAAEKAHAEAEARLEHSRRSQYATRLMLVGTLWKSDPVTGRLLLEDRDHFPAELRDFTWHYLHRLCDRQRPPLRGHQGAVRVVAASPDGRTLASGGDDHTVRLWDPRTGACRATLGGHTGRVTSLSFSGDGALLASASDDRTVRLWDAASGSERRVLTGHADRVVGVAVAPDGRTVVSASHDCTVRLWDVGTGKERASVKSSGEAHAISAVFCPDGKTLALGSCPGIVKLCDPATLQERALLRGSRGGWQGASGGIGTLAFTPDGQTLAAADFVLVTVWDVAQKRERAVLNPRMDGGSISVAVSPGGRTVAVGGNVGDDGTSAVKLWDAAGGEMRGIVRDAAPGVTSVAFAGAGRLAFGSSDGTVKVWEVGGGPERGTLGPHSVGVWSVAFSPDGKTLASAAGEWWKENKPTEVRLWDAKSGRPRAVLQGHGGYVTSAVFSPDGATLATAGWDQTVRLWDAAAGTQSRTLTGHTAVVWAVAFSPDGATLASAAGDPKRRDRPGEVRLWDARTGRPRDTLRGHDGGVFCLGYSPDGHTLATGGWDGTVRLWDAASGQEQAVLRGEGEVWCVAFSPDGKTLASGTGDLAHRTLPGEVRLWDLEARQVRARLRGHTGGVFAASYSPDGRTLATGGNDGAVKLWDPQTGPERATLSGHVRWVRSVTFSPDGRLLASGSGDGTVKLWDASRGRHDD